MTELIDFRPMAETMPKTGTPPISEGFTLLFLSSITASAGTKTKQYFIDLHQDTKIVGAATANETKQALSKTYDLANAPVVWTGCRLSDTKDQLKYYFGVNPGEATASFPTEKTAKVDMKLSWINILDKKWGELSTDLVTICAFANIRWNKATAVAAPQIAAIIDEGKVKFVDVPGVNSAGMEIESLAKLEKAIALRPNETMAVCHSAGTDACAQSMALTTRNKSEVFYLILSPRMAPSQYAEYMKKAGIPPSQVITMNSTWDFPHKGDFSVFPENKWARALAPFSPTVITTLATSKAVSILPDFWHDYENAPGNGMHVMIVKNYSKEGVAGLLHSSMYDGLTNGDLFQVVINGKHVVNKITLPQIIRALRDGEYK